MELVTIEENCGDERRLRARLVRREPPAIITVTDSADPFALADEYFEWRRARKLPLPAFARSLRILRTAMPPESKPGAAAALTESVRIAITTTPLRARGERRARRRIIAG
jgi:hypothetical protein